MKHNKELYEQTAFYDCYEDYDVTNHKQKVVKCKVKHTCVACKKTIKAKEEALRETGFLDGEPVSAYTCIECCDKWLDEITGEQK